MLTVSWTRHRGVWTTTHPIVRFLCSGLSFSDKDYRMRSVPFVTAVSTASSR